MKKLLLLSLAAAFIFGCEKESEEKITTIEETTTETSDTRAAWPPKKFKIKIKLKIDSGKRSTASTYDDLGIGDGSKCQGRGFCIHAISDPGGGGDDVVEGDAAIAAPDFEPGDTQYAFTLASDMSGGFLFSVDSGEITEDLSEKIFAEDVFIMDADYKFPEDVADALGVSECVLPKGTYEVTKDSEGRTYFEF